LLCTLVDELSSTEGYEPAAALARALKTRIDGGPISDEIFLTRLHELRQCVRGLAKAA
jgi:hypothetical protein